MMKESLEDLGERFNEWRKKRGSVRERVPEDLRARVERAVKLHGVSRVAGATKLSSSWFSVRNGRKAKAVKSTLLPIPSFSRVELAPPPARSSPVAEAETARGMKLRIFSFDSQSIELLSSFYRAGGAA